MKERIPAWLTHSINAVMVAVIVGIGGWVWSAHASISCLQTTQTAQEKTIDRIDRNVQRLLDLHTNNPK
jgi:hypothetical protein